MAEAFKNLINPALVQASALHLARAWPAFDSRRFVREANNGLEALEMKARAMQICAALQATLPADFGHAATVIEATLAPPEPGEAMAQLEGIETGLRGWILWPVGEFVARQGLAHPERALAALHAITQRFTAEFAIRPFIVEHPALSYATLARWAHDDSAHVRRLVSEGSRPRLPWGQQLKHLINDPAPSWPLLRALMDDKSEYVRRSVANHLNDIAKDHADAVCEWVETHRPKAPPERLALLRHASRTLIKSGHPRMLAAWGLGQGFVGTVALQLSAGTVRVGQSFELRLQLQSSAAKAQTLAIDYVLHHVKAKGGTTPKVFKGWVITLAPKARVELSKQHSMREITTRSYHPGVHGVSLQVNGQCVATCSFVLQAAG
jgi:3-methyladenine DNA glycosylase AlkC